MRRKRYEWPPPRAAARAMCVTAWPSMRRSRRGRVCDAPGVAEASGDSGVAGRQRSPAFREQVGQAPQPCPTSTFSAILICCARVALSAVTAYALPP